MAKGKLILAPCGSGKTTWLSKLSKSEGEMIRDGDNLLLWGKISNRNIFWYSSEKYKEERKRIKEIFAVYLLEGYSILYSGNPLLMADLGEMVIVMPPASVRWERLNTRKLAGEWCPSREQFQMEEDAYNTAIEGLGVRVVLGDLPDVGDLLGLKPRVPPPVSIPQSHLDLLNSIDLPPFVPDLQRPLSPWRSL